MCYFVYFADPEINYMLELYGNQSLCFEHQEPWTIKHCRVTHSLEHWGSGCYQVRVAPLWKDHLSEIQSGLT